MLLHPDVLIRLRLVPHLFTNITNTLIKYSYTYAPALRTRKSHCGPVIVWQSILFLLSLGRHDKRDLVVVRKPLLPRASSQRSENEKRFHCFCRCCRNENEKTRDFSTLFPLDFLFHFLRFFPPFCPIPFCLFLFDISYLSIWWHDNFSRRDFYCITNSNTLCRSVETCILCRVKIYLIIEYYNFLKIYL